LRGRNSKGETKFDRIQISASAFFRSDEFDGKTLPVRFAKAVRFLAARFKGDADFQGTEFGGECNFDRAYVEGSAFFLPDKSGRGVTFRGPSWFSNATFGEGLWFRSASFGGSVDFYRVSVDGPAFFQPYGDAPTLGPQVEFHDRAHFRGMRIMGDANFSGAVFHKFADFSALSVEGRANFREDALNRPVEFHADPEQSSAPTPTATFSWSTTLSGAHFQDVSFLGCRFEGRTNFENVRVDRWISFVNANFADQLSFREAQLGVLFLRRSRSESEKELQPARFEAVDFRGCRYARIYVDPGFLSRLFGARFAHHPYDELERALRAVGEDRQADDVYLAHKHAERKHQYQEGAYLKWLVSTLHWVTARYGIRPYQLIAVPAVLLLLSAFVFALPGAVWLREPAAAGIARQPVPVSFVRALGFGLGQLLPVELPIAASYKPTEQEISFGGRNLWVTFDGFATVMRLVGWLLVPLAIGAVAGALRRKRSARAAAE
jgi:uncharacterized protein YjbI with pentapeptide repeats